MRAKAFTIQNQMRRQHGWHQRIRARVAAGAVMVLFAPVATGQLAERVDLNKLRAPVSDAAAAARAAPANITESMRQSDSALIMTAKGLQSVGELRREIITSMDRFDASKQVGKFDAAQSAKGDNIKIDKPAGAVDVGIFDNPVLADTSEIAEIYENNSCDGKSPSIWKTQGGTITPGANIRILGQCLGEKAGQVRLYGSFASGFRNLPISGAWGDTLKVQIPASIAGVGDETMRIEVVAADRRATNSLEVEFVAARETVNVSDLWVGNCRNDQGRWIVADCHLNRATYFGTYESAAISSGEQPLTPPWVSWQIEINPKCRFENFRAEPLIGTSFYSGNGFSGSGLPHKASAMFSAQGRVVRKGGFFTDTEEVSSAHSVHATASCPVGISPIP
jgi:hypothetical protein